MNRTCRTVAAITTLSALALSATPSRAAYFGKTWRSVSGASSPEIGTVTGQGNRDYYVLGDFVTNTTDFTDLGYYIPVDRRSFPTMLTPEGVFHRSTASFWTYGDVYFYAATFSYTTGAIHDATLNSPISGSPTGGARIFLLSDVELPAAGSAAAYVEMAPGRVGTRTVRFNWEANGS